MRLKQYLRIHSRRKQGFPKMIVRGGREKGKIAVVVKDPMWYTRKLDVKLDSGKEMTIHYTNLDLLGSTGEPIREDVTDMTGRLIEPDNWICYSSPGHALEVGKVLKVNESGMMIVMSSIRNGQKTQETRHVTDSDRCLKLPVDSSQMTLWILRGFNKA